MIDTFPIPAPFGSLNLRDDQIVLGKLAPNTLVDVLNMEHYASGLKTRDGYSAYSGALTAGKAVMNLYPYRKKDGTSILLAVCGTNLYKEGATPGAFSSIRSGLADGKTWDFATIVDLCIGVNGVSADAVKYDGTTVYPLAIAPPGIAPSLASGGAGTLSGEFKYKVSFVSKWGAETNAGPSSALFTASANSIALSGIPVGGSDAAYVKLYRTTAGGSIYYSLGQIVNGTTTYWDNTTDINLGTDLAPADHDSPPGDLEMLMVWKEHLWGIPASEPTTAYFSHQSYPEIFYTDPDVGYRLNIGLNDGEKVIGIFKIGNTLFFSKENSTWPVTGDAPDDFRTPPEAINGSVGLYHRSVQALPDGTRIGLHRSGVYVFNGYQFVKVSDRDGDSIQAKIDGLNPNRLKYARGFYDPHKRRYHLFATESGYSYNNLELTLDLTVNKWTVFDRKANDAVVWNDQILLASSMTDGYVYKIGGTNDAGVAISIRAEFPWLGLWDPDTLKLIRALLVDTTQTGTDYMPEFEVYLDARSRAHATWLEEGSLWGSGKWALEGGLYRIKKILKVDRKNVAYLKIKMNHSGLNQPVTLNGLAVLGMASDRLVMA